MICKANLCVQQFRGHQKKTRQKNGIDSVCNVSSKAEVFSIFNNFSFAGNIAALSGVNTCSCTMQDCVFDIRQATHARLCLWVDIFGNSHTKKIFLLR